jgi:prepilin-type N-terminal cleavage/methylation domain-containing protein
MKEPSARPGFTLIELMIVVAIIGILAAIAIPKFASLIRKSSEGACKGNLGAIRSALAIYYGDMEGRYPIDATALTVNGKYLAAIPTAKAPNYHADTSVMESLPAACASVGMDFNDFRNGGWIYCGAPNDPLVGSVYVNCTHTDTKSTVWTTY